MITLEIYFKMRLIKINLLHHFVKFHLITLHLHWVYQKQKSKTSSNPITVLENVCIRVGEIQIGWGRELQSRGAARKALSPQLFLLVSLSFAEIEERTPVRVVKEV